MSRYSHRKVNVTQALVLLIALLLASCTTQIDLGPVGKGEPTASRPASTIGLGFKSNISWREIHIVAKSSGKNPTENAKFLVIYSDCGGTEIYIDELYVGGQAINSMDGQGRLMNNKAVSASTYIPDRFLAEFERICITVGGGNSSGNRISSNVIRIK